MNYEFYEAKWFWGRNYLVPWFDILDEEYQILDGLSWFSWESIRWIVEKLEKVKSWEKIIRGEWMFKWEPFKIEHDFVDMWVDIVWVYAYWPNAEDEKLRNKCVIEWNYSDYYEIIPFEEIEELMKDYLTEIDKWEEKTGREKPGW